MKQKKIFFLQRNVSLEADFQQMLNHYFAIMVTYLRQNKNSSYSTNIDVTVMPKMSTG